MPRMSDTTNLPGARSTARWAPLPATPTAITTTRLTLDVVKGIQLAISATIGTFLAAIKGKGNNGIATKQISLHFSLNIPR